MINIVLVEPEIPQNTGNIARTCAATNIKLHIVKPMGFEISDKTVKRAGLDYWQYLNYEIYENWADFAIKNAVGTYFFCSTKAKIKYSDVTYPANCYLIFGKETKGLDEKLIFDNFDHAITIPMQPLARSLNLANSVAIILFEALRQIDFVGLD